MSYGTEDQGTDTQWESRWETEAQERDQHMSDRHEKWQPVEPGHVIPAGQPYRVEWTQGGAASATEFYGSKADWVVRPKSEATFVDSSWRPPLELPTEPTWGIVLSEGTPRLARWYRTADGTGLSTGSDCIGIESVLDFIPLTPEQVERVERAR